MAEVIRFDDFEEFVESVEDFIASNPMLYFFLNTIIDDIYEGNQKAIKFFIIKSEQSTIVTLFAEEICMIYDNGFDEELVSVLDEELEFGKFKRKEFAGCREIIEALFRKYNSGYEILKHRVIYKCSSVKDDFKYAPGQMESAAINSFVELVEFSKGFSKDYFGEEISSEKAASLVGNGISSSTLFQWSHDDNACSMAQVLDEHDFPVVGHFYTPPSQRNKGYGASLIHALTNELLVDGNSFVMLATNALTPESNRAFIKAGYFPVGEFFRAYKNGE